MSPGKRRQGPTGNAPVGMSKAVPYSLHNPTGGRGCIHARTYVKPQHGRGNGLIIYDHILSLLSNLLNVIKAVSNGGNSLGFQGSPFARILDHRNLREKVEQHLHHTHNSPRQNSSLHVLLLVETFLILS